MARPIKDGVDYFPLDTDIFSPSADDGFRILKAQQGAKGVVIYLYLLCQIYGKNGYFLPWDEDAGVLASDGVGCSCTPQYIFDVVNCCVKRGLFDKNIFTEFGVLTSRGIQRRYVRMFNSRDEIRMKQEYFLLDMDSKKDVPESVRRKLAFFSDKSTENPDKSTENPQKEKEREKESKGKESKNPSPPSDLKSLSEWQEYITMRETRDGRKVNAKLLDMIYGDLVSIAGNDEEKARRVLRNAIKKKSRYLCNLTPQKETSFDLDEVERFTNSQEYYDNLNK